MREPRLRDEKFLKLIRQLPCLVPLCTNDGGISHRGMVEAAHIRMGARFDLGIHESGSHKPHDALVVPLCAHHHRMGSDAEHRIGTKRFWEIRRVDAHYVALQLYQAYRSTDTDLEALQAMRAIVLEERFSSVERIGGIGRGR